MLTSRYTQEYQYQQAINSDILNFWQKREVKTFVHRGVELYCCHFTHPEHRKAIVIVNGRIESVIKYQELIFDLFHQGYDIYAYDHRGQGFSDRLVEGSDIGHVEWFDDYVDDLTQVVANWDLARYQKRFLLAHSMGGTVALRYLQRNPNAPFDAIAACSPMLALPVPRHLKYFVIPYTRWLAQRSPQPNYAPGYGPYTDKPFENNPLTHSEKRYTWFRALYRHQPELQVGGPSARWIWQSLVALKALKRDANKLKTPLLILQAQLDTIIDNRGHTQLLKRVKRRADIQLVSFPQANHELLCETDAIRNAVLQHIDHYFSSF